MFLAVGEIINNLFKSYAVRRKKHEIMLEFKKYSSIENSYNREFVERVMAEMPTDLAYVVQEKVHGSNASFLCDGQEVQFAKRTSVVSKEEKFYNYEELLEAYSERVILLFANVQARYPDVKSISVFGEMFGGSYPHPDVARIGRLTAIQKGVFYTPKHEFYGFDIYIFTENEEKYLTVNETNEIFEQEGFFYAKTLLQGSLAECLRYPDSFESLIPKELGLPPIEGNICEGVVIRPIEPKFFRNGARVLIKNKNERFAEKKSVRKRDMLLIEKPEYSKELQVLIDEATCFVTENRLNNVISHIGEVQVPKDFGKIMGLFSKDALADFLKEHGKAYNDLEKAEQKMLNKELNRLATELVKKRFMQPVVL